MPPNFREKSGRRQAAWARGSRASRVLTSHSRPGGNDGTGPPVLPYSGPMKVHEQTPSRLVLRYVAVWIWLIGAWALAATVSQSQESAITCRREASGGSCFLEKVYLVPRGEPYRGWMQPVPLEDIAYAGVEDSGSLFLERRKGRRVYLPGPPMKGIAPEDAAARINTFLQDGEAPFLRILRGWPARFGLRPLGAPALVALLFLLVATFSDLVVTVTVDKAAGRLVVRRRGLLFAREEAFALGAVVGVEVQHLRRSSTSTRLCLVLDSGERRPVRTVYLQGRGETDRQDAERLREFLGLARAPASVSAGVARPRA